MSNMQRSGAMRKKERPLIPRSQASVTFALTECDESESSFDESEPETVTESESNITVQRESERKESDTGGDDSETLDRLDGVEDTPRDQAEPSDSSAKHDEPAVDAAGDKLGSPVDGETDR